MTPELQAQLPKLKRLVEDHVVSAVDREKTYQYATARKNELYFRGKQYVYPVMVDQQIADWSPISGTIKYHKEEVPGRYDYVLNMIRGDGMKFVAVLGTRAPNVKAMPDRLDDEASVRLARRIDGIVSELRAAWNVERLQRKLALSLWKNGTTFGYTPYVVDGRKYGWREEPNIELVDQPMGEAAYHCVQCGADTPPAAFAGACPQCGTPLSEMDLVPPETAQVPQEVGPPTRYPNGDAELHLETIFRVTTNFYGDSIASLPWIWCEYEEHRAAILSAFDDGRHEYAMQKLREMVAKSGDSTGSSVSGSLESVGRLARDVASSPSGSYISPRRDRWLYSRFWLSPAMYSMLKDEDAELKQALVAEYPDGIKITMIDGEPIDAENEDLRYVWACCFPSPGESMYPDPVCTDYVQVQDLINDAHNITVETAERGNPVTFFDPQVLDMAALRRSASTPAEYLPAIAGVGKRLQDSMWVSPKTELSQPLIAWMQSLIAQARENCGILPALFGGEGPSQTAYEASRKLNQALMQLSPIWNEMRSFWQQAFMNGIRQRRANRPDYEDIAMEGWHLEVEESIPMTWGQIRDFFSLLLDKGPEAWQMLGLGHPSNLSNAHSALGLHGWVIPNLKEREHIIDTIRELLNGVPVPTPMGLQASIPPDDLEFTPPLVIDVVKDWLAGDEGRDTKAQQPEGYANVLAWARGFMIMMQPPPMPVGPPPKGSSAAPPGPPEAPETEVIPGGQPLPQGAAAMGVPVPPPPPSVQ